MKGKKLILAMAAFALVAVVVGVLVLPEPKEAKADEIRTCFLIDNINFDPVQDADVEFSKETAPDIWSAWQDGEEDGFGLGEYKFVFDSLPYRWRVRVQAPWHGDDPWGDVQTFYASQPESFEWIVFSE